MSRRRLAAAARTLLLSGALAAALPALARAGAVPGAVYTGTAADGATVTVTVSSDGTRVSAYRLLGVLGHDAHGNGCQDATSVGPTGWPGAAISSGSFSDSIGSSFMITGTFGRAQSVSGTFALDQPAQGGSTGCSTGTVTWTATTASPAQGGGGSGGRTAVAVRVRLRRVSPARVGGRLTAPATACVARRTVYLWSGHRQLTRARTSAHGVFAIGLRRAWRHRSLHVQVHVLRTATDTCRAAASTAIRG